MLHPVGSLPPRVYWQRRVAGIVVVLFLVVVPFLLLSSRDRSEASGADSPAPARPASTPQLELIPAQPLRTSTPAPSTSEPSTTPPPTSQPPAGQPPSGTQPPASQPPPSGTQPPLAAAVPCTGEMLTVTAGAEQPQYSVADKPILTMTVQNVSAQPCTRDLGTTHQEWGLFDGDTRLWGSNDCLFQPGVDVQTLQPAQRITLRVEWSGMTSDPDCAEPRRRLAPGDYEMSARIGTAASPRAPLILR